METLIGIACNDFVLLASDMTNVNSLFVMKNGMHIFFTVFLKLFSNKIFLQHFQCIPTCLSQS